MKRCSIRFVSTVFLIALFAGAASASLTGRIVDQSGAPLSNAIVQLLSAGVADTTAADGQFTFTTTGVLVPAASSLKQSISCANGIISFTISSEAEPVTIRVFDVSGRQVAPSFTQELSTGEYSFDALSLIKSAALGKIFIARASLDGKMYSYKISFLAGERRGLMGSGRGNDVRSSGLSKRETTVDSLKVSKSGYVTSTLPVSSYDAALGDITLSTQQYALTTVCNPADGSITTPSTSPVNVNYGAATTITASPNACYSFSGWTVTSGTATFGSATSASTTVTLTSGNSTVQANFLKNTYILHIYAGTGGTISAPFVGLGSQLTVNCGAPLTISASPNTGYYFVNWTITAGTATIASATSASTTVTLTSDNASLQANFDVNCIASTDPTSISASVNRVAPNDITANSATLTINGGTLGTGAKWFWYAGNGYTNLINDGVTSITVSPLTSTNYWVRAVGTCGTTSGVSVYIIANYKPVVLHNAGSAIQSIDLPIGPAILSTTDQETTDPASIIYTVTSLPTASVGQLYSAASGGHGFLAVGATFTQADINGTGSVGVGYAPYAAGVVTIGLNVTDGYWTVPCNLTITVTACIASTAPTSAGASWETVAPNDPTYRTSTLTVYGGTLGTGASWKWYSDAGFSTLVGTGVNISVAPVVRTTYYVRGEGTCGTTSAVSHIIDVNYKPVIVHNAGTATVGTNQPIAAAILSTTDIETTDPASIIYTVTSLPTASVGQLYSAASGGHGFLAVGATFTQADINGTGSVGVGYAPYAAGVVTIGLTVTDGYWTVPCNLTISVN